jgi:hypothetical protein
MSTFVSSVNLKKQFELNLTFFQKLNTENQWLLKRSFEFYNSYYLLSPAKKTEHKLSTQAVGVKVLDRCLLR